MTTQGVEITVGNSMMSKVFTDTSTDGQWSGNVLTDSIAGQSLGILIPNATLTYAQAGYNSGAMAYRIQNAQSLRVSARGFGVLNGQYCMSESSIGPVRVNPNDILTVFPVPAAAGAASNVLAWVETTKGTELMQAVEADDGAAVPLTTAINGQTLGDAFFNSTLRSVKVQVQDGHSLTQVQVVDEMGGIVMTLQGGFRGASTASRSNEYNLYTSGLGIGIGKGWSLKVVCKSDE
jgi:hypothetical protein